MEMRPRQCGLSGERKGRKAYPFPSLPGALVVVFCQPGDSRRRPRARQASTAQTRNGRALAIEDTIREKLPDGFLTSKGRWIVHSVLSLSDVGARL